MSLTADELDSQVDFSAAAGLTWDVVLPDHSLHAEIHYGEGGLGGLIRHDALLSRSLSLRTELNYFSGGESLASIGLQFRF